jgi:hypothetical protein
MSEVIQETVTVGMSSTPKWIKWKNRVYKIDQIGLHHKYYEGKTLYHIFSVISKNTFLKIKLNTENLIWQLEEISHGF